jgi:hypothetical protein
MTPGIASCGRLPQQRIGFCDLLQKLSVLSPDTAFGILVRTTRLAFVMHIGGQRGRLTGCQYTSLTARTINRAWHEDHSFVEGDVAGAETAKPRFGRSLTPRVLDYYTDLVEYQFFP